MKRSILLLIMLIATAFAAQIFAAGTPAGTVIENFAVGNYEDANGNPMATVYSDTTYTTVAQAAGVDIDPNANQNIRRNSFVDYAMTVTNTGNGSDTFTFNINTTNGGSGTFSEDIYYDANGNGVIDGGESTVSQTSAMAADAEYDIVVRVSVSGGDRGEVGETIVEAVSQYNGGVSDADTLNSTVLAAEIAGALTVDNQVKAPNEVITYTLIFNNNAGTDTAFTTMVTLPVPPLTDWVGNVTFNGVPTGTGEGVAVNAGDMEVGDADTITYQVRVESDATAGATIDNTVNINYDDSQDIAYTQVDVSTVIATDRVTVSQQYAFTTSVADDSLEGDPGDNVTYSIKVKNTGNGTDDYDITESGGQGWTWVYYLDDNNDGTPDGPAITNTGSLTSGDSTYVLAVVTIPAGTADGTEDLTDVQFESSGNGATRTERLVTTVTAPFLVLSKSVLPGGNQPPGTVLTYSVIVTNTGTGQAINVVVTDDIPDDTTYESGTLEIDSASKTDGTGDDEASCDGNTATFSLGTMAASASHTVSFQVEID